MRCPACKNTVEPDAWLCPFCEHIIDPSVLEADESDDLAASEPTKMMTNPLRPEADDGPLPDAVILGDVGIAEDEFGVVEGAGVQSDGRTSTFLYYTGGASTRVVHPDAIPRLTHREHEQPRTPYEDFILSCIDGALTVRQIQKASGLQPQEVVVTLLTLMDKGAVEIRTSDGGPGASPASGNLRDARPERAPRRPRRGRPPAPPVVPQPLEEDEGLATQALAPVTPRPRAPVPVPQGFDEDLPSVSDFHEIMAEAPTGDLDAVHPGLVEPPRPPPRRPRLPVPEEETQLGVPPSARAESLSDVWAQAPSAPLDADALVESELLEETDEVPDVLVVPSPLDPPPGEEDDDDAPFERPFSRGLEDSESGLAPVIPSDLDDDDGDGDVTKEVFIPAKLRPPHPGDRPPSLALPPRGPAPPARTRPSVSSGSARPAPRPTAALVVPATTSQGAVPVLDPALLQPLDPSRSERAQAPRPPSPPPAGPRRAIVDVVRRAPIHERRREGEAPEVVARPADPPPRAAPEPPPRAVEPRAVEPRERAAEAGKDAPVVDSLRMMKAQKLFEQALKDKADGNLISARMNMKLAITFDPTNELYAEALDDISKSPDASRSAGPGPAGRSKAREYYDAATAAENAGDVDRAIELLEKAVAESRQAVFLNRLGVILAMKRQQFVRAQELIEQAIELSPGNATYEKNLHKILSRAAAHDVAASGRDGGKKGGLLGFLGRRK